MTERLCPGCQAPLVRREKESERAYSRRKFCNRACAGLGRGVSAQGKLRFKSRFSDRYLSIHQYLAEVMCERRARAHGNTLPPFFWDRKPYKDLFRFQVICANRLLARFPPSVLGAVLRSPEGRKVYSLALPQIEDWCRQEMARHPPEPPPPSPAPPAPEEKVDPGVFSLPEGFRPAVGKPRSLRQALRAIDAAQEGQ